MSVARVSGALIGAAVAAFVFTSDASASGFGGGSGGGSGNFGDTYINDAQKNPRFIEPGAQNDPARYRIGAPYEGYTDRQAAREGYYDPGSGYFPVAPRRGRITVQPY